MISLFKILRGLQNLKIGVHMKTANIFPSQWDDVIHMMLNTCLLSEPVSFCVKQCNLFKIRPNWCSLFYVSLGKFSVRYYVGIASFSLFLRPLSTISPKLIPMSFVIFSAMNFVLLIKTTGFSSLFNLNNIFTVVVLCFLIKAFSAHTPFCCAQGYMSMFTQLSGKIRFLASSYGFLSWRNHGNKNILCINTLQGEI